jgi:hypothetical protein
MDNLNDLIRKIKREIDKLASSIPELFNNLLSKISRLK